MSEEFSEVSNKSIRTLLEHLIVIAGVLKQELATWDETTRGGAPGAYRSMGDHQARPISLGLRRW